jgi:hypothetical protein
LAGEHGQENRQHDEPIERRLESTDDRGRDERGEEIELQPRVTDLEASRPVPSRSSFSTPTIVPACALSSNAWCSKRVWPRTVPSSFPPSPQMG